MNVVSKVPVPDAAEIPYFRDRLRVERLADLEAYERVPLSERNLPASTYEMLGQAAARDPGAPAIHAFASGDELDRAVTITHGAAFARVTQTANLLHRLGVGPDDAVGLLMPIVPETLYALWGSQAAGIACPVNWMLEPEIIAKLLAAARIRVLVAFGPHPDFEIWGKVEQIRARLPDLRAIVQVGGERLGDPGIVRYDDVIDGEPADRLVSGRRIQAGDRAALFHTGGTTGTPKLAMHTHGNQVFMCWSAATQYDVRPDDVRVCGVPLFHVTGVITNCLMPVSCGASTVLLTPGGYRDPSVLRNLWRIVERFGVTMLGMVPTVVNSALNIPIGDSDVSSLKLVSCGTAPLSTAVATAFARMTGAAIIEGYGLTEGTALSAANPRYGEARIGSIGLRHLYQPMRVVKIDANGRVARDCEPGESGLIVISGPNVFAGYLDAEATRKAFVAEGWLNTGDLGYQDADGYFWITGRAKDLIIRGGNNIDPRLVDEIFYAHADILDAATVGMPDAHAGELPVTYVSPRPGREINLRRLKFYAYETIPERAAVPKRIYVIPALPKTAVGKIQKNLLRLDAVRRGQAELLAEVEGLDGLSIEVRDLGDAGLHSTITVPGVPLDERAPAEARIREALRALTVRYEIRFG